MTEEEIREIKEMYLKHKDHRLVMRHFNLSLAQEYAINVYGRDNHIAPEVIAQNIAKVKDGMTTIQIAKVFS